jgi:integrase
MANQKREKKTRGAGYLYKRGGFYWIEYRANGARVREALRDEEGRGITEKDAAILAQSRIVNPLLAMDKVQAAKDMVARLQTAEAAAAVAKEQAAPLVVLAAVWEAYRAAPNRPDSSEATLEQYAFQWKRLEAWLHDNRADYKELREVTETDAEQYAGFLTKQVGPSTYNRHITFLKCLFRVLAKQARLTGNVWDTVSRKRAVGQSRRELTIDELRRMCASAKGELRTLLAVGLYTGLRLGDCATLRWGETDLLRRVITRIPQKTGRKNPKPVIVPIHADLALILSGTTPENRDGYVMPEYAETYNRERTTVSDRVQRHFIKNGIQIHAPGTGGDTGKRAVVEVGFHSLRHSFVSMCRQAGAPLSVVESIVGHSSPAMTRHYTHTGEEAARVAVAALPSVTGKKERPQLPPLPDWALKLVKHMTADNWEEVKCKLATRCQAAPKAQHEGKALKA